MVSGSGGYATYRDGTLPAESETRARRPSNSSFYSFLHPVAIRVSSSATSHIGRTAHFPLTTHHSRMHIGANAIRLAPHVGHTT